MRGRVNKGVPGKEKTSSCADKMGANHSLFSRNLEKGGGGEWIGRRGGFAPSKQ